MPCVPNGDNLKSYPFFIWKNQKLFVSLSMKLRGLIIVLMLLGVMTLEAKPKYRIQSWIIGGTKMYLPQQKVWLRTSMGTLPIKVWASPDYPSQSKREAEEVIRFWKQNELDKNSYKKSEFININ